MNVEGNKDKPDQVSNTSVYKKFRLLGILGCICGDFPVKNAVTGRVSNRLSFKIFSFHFIWSLIALVLRLGSVFSILINLTALFASDYGIYTVTDLAALGVMIASTLGFGAIAHILNLSRTRGLVRMLQVLDLYDDKYAPRKATKLLTKRFVVCMLSSCLIACFPALIIIQETPTEAIKKFVHKNNLDDDVDSIAIIPRLTLVTAFVEYGSLFHYAVLFYTSHLFKKRFEEMLEMLRDKSAKKSSFGSQMSYTSKGYGRKREKLELFEKSVLGNVGNKSWKAMAEQYLDFCDIYELFQGFVGQYFIVLFLTLIISLICMVYVVSNIGSMFVADTTPILIGVTCFSFVRILFLCNVGEEFENTQKQMVKVLGRLEEGTFWPEEKQEFDRFVNLIKTIPIRLSANGFFMVNRKNATSILSVIITYIIVLIQFRLSSHGNVFNNTTTNFILNLTSNSEE